MKKLIRTKDGAFEWDVRSILGEKILVVESGRNTIRDLRGAVLVHNTELPIRSRAEARYLVVQEGLFHAERLCRHASRGSRAEELAIRERRDQALVVAEQLLRTNRISIETRDALRGWLMGAQTDYSKPKRNSKKLRAGEQFARSRVYNDAGGRGIGKSSMLAYAGQHNLRVRRDDLRRIFQAINQRTLVIRPIIEDACSVVNEIWEFVEGDRWLRDGAGISGEASALKFSPDARDQRALHNAIETRCARLKTYVEPYMPFTWWASQVIDGLREYGTPYLNVGFSVLEGLQRMRTIIFLEERIFMLTFGSERDQMEAKRKLGVMCERIGRVSPNTECPPILTSVLVESIQTALAQPKPRETAKKLKEITSLLAKILP